MVDSRSTDSTAERAARAGAMVYRVGPRGRDGGKGGAMQTGLARMSGEVGVFLDADIEDFDPAFVVRLLDPLLRDPSLVIVKGFYDRPTPGGGGGRVTELVARPLLRRIEPRLLGLTQPLAGECAFIRAPLLRLPFVSGYGVETGMLLQVLRAHGLDAIGQVDLGVRLHSQQDLDALARMTVQVETRPLCASTVAPTSLASASPSSATRPGPWSCGESGSTPGCCRPWSGRRAIVDRRKEPSESLDHIFSDIRLSLTDCRDSDVTLIGRAGQCAGPSSASSACSASPPWCAWIRRHGSSRFGWPRPCAWRAADGSCSTAARG